MEAAFSGIAFVEPARAERNLEVVAGRLPAGLWPTLPALLAQVPDPDGALNYLERFLRECPPRVADYLERHPAALHYLLVIFSYSRFLSESLIQQHELITWLHRPGGRDTLERIKSPDDLDEEFARFEATAYELAPSVILARFKRREYLRITLRDVLGLATLAETTLELSHLADVLLERALRLSEQRLLNLYGTPQAADESGRRQPVRMTILSLGKLGGQELNYASDIDLMFLYGQDGETSGGNAGAISNAEYFVRLAQAILKLVTEVTPEGAVYRADLRLRPQGREGDVAMSVPAALDYYRTRAREWELQMLIKARGSAGDITTARAFLAQVRPLVFRSEFHLAAVEAVLNARDEITRGLRRRPGRRAEKWNVKLSPGGIRDIEFLAQCLQRLYGGRDPWLAGASTASTLVALGRLNDKGYLGGRDFFRLGTAYQFLRRVEHRLQLRDGLQRHALPEAPDALDRLARRCGIEASPADGRPAGEQLLQRIRQHFAEVREIYERILARPAEEPSDVDAGAADPAAGAFIRRLRRERPRLAQALAAAQADAHARRGLERFLTSALLLPEFAAKLERHPEWLAPAAELFAASDLAVEMLARHPEEIAVVAGGEPATQAAPETAGDFEGRMAALRVTYRRGVVASVAQALRGTPPFETYEALSQLADQALTGALELAACEQGVMPADGDAGRVLAAAPLAVVALGRLGTREMDISSDADLVFLADESLSAEQREPWRRLAERFVHVVSSHTRDGLLLPVDTRLRPRGSEGDLVQSAAYLREYCATEARGWEAATWLKARPVAGNQVLAARSIAEAQDLLASRFGQPGVLAAELSQTRELLVRETAGPRPKGELKKIPGGFYDLEYVLAFLFLTHRPVTPGGHVLRQIAALESAGALDAQAAHTLRSSALLYRGLDHAVRLITGRTAGRMPEPALAERVACLLERWGVPLPPGDSSAGRIERAFLAARSELRALYDSLITAAASRPAE